MKFEIIFFCFKTNLLLYLIAKKSIYKVMYLYFWGPDIYLSDFAFFAAFLRGELKNWPRGRPTRATSPNLENPEKPGYSQEVGIKYKLTIDG